MKRHKLHFLFLTVFLSATAYAEVLNNLEVVWVVDGDTVHATKNGQLYKIRLTEIDAPERDQPFGKQSTDNLKSFLRKGFIDVDLEGQDIYKRHLGRIYVDGTDINKKMVSTGSAWVYDKYVTDESFYIEQKKAQNNKLGIWADEEAMPPWVWRQRNN